MRLDILLTKRKLVKSRETGADLIKAGKVIVNDEIVIKPAKDFPDKEGLIIKILEQPKFVSRGGLKLERALAEFKLNPSGLIALDVGSSTGGFTDCLLQKGVKRVYAIDVGTNQFDSKLRNDPRIILKEQTDIRDVKNLPEEIDLAVIDVSFISLELVLKVVKILLKRTGQIIALVKPQFETTKTAKNKSGVVKTDEIRREALEKIEVHCSKIGLKTLGTIDSPVLGGSGNKEYLILLQNS